MYYFLAGLAFRRSPWHCCSRRVRMLQPPLLRASPRFTNWLLLLLLLRRHRRPRRRLRLRLGRQRGIYSTPTQALLLASWTL
jgi:hypothetical protein